MKDLSLLAKLLAEEDIHVVHRQQPTAMFDVLNRELSLPIWKDMSKNIQDLMTLHEVGHALWTPLEMMEKIKEQKISHSVCNVLEDVRIEKAIQLKYKGAVKIFNKGYQELIHSNFFETVGKKIENYNLIDRINLHYKHHVDVPFSDDEMVWVKKANETVTSDDVIELAKELIKFIEENKDSQDKDTNTDDMMDAGEGNSSMGNENTQEEKSEKESEEHSDNGNTADSKPADEGSNPSAPAKSEDEDSEEPDKEKVEVKTSSGSEGGKSDDDTITSATDNAWNESSKKFLNDDGK